NDASTWNDLAAARYAAAIHDQRPSLLPLALADADHALQLDPRGAEALFNRALIVEGLGARAQTRRAWERYLDAEPNTGWSIEAREHLRRHAGGRPAFDPRLLETGDLAAVVRAFPREARTYGEVLLLAGWGDAVAASDTKGAAAALAHVRDLGNALLASRGEGLLADSVAAIERAAPPARTKLAEAHRLYRDGKRAITSRRPAEGERRLRAAATLFRAGGSPMAGMALYFAASAALDQNRGTEAREELLRLLAGVDPQRHAALAAQIHWTLALGANVAGDWGSAVREAEASAALFRNIGESSNAAFVDSIGAHALEVIGDADRSWTSRLRAIASLCDGSDTGGCNALFNDAAMALTSIGRSKAAVALLDLSSDDGSAVEPSVAAIRLQKRARVAATAEPERAPRSLAAAREASWRMPDVAMRERVQTEIDVDTASMQRSTNPRAAIATLNLAAAFFERRQLWQCLPYVELQRARAHRAAGDDTAAVASYGAALAEIDQQQRRIADRDLRLSFLDTATQAIEETIELHLAHDSIAEALDVADRRHELLDAGGPVPAARASRLPVAPDTAIIEYAVLPRAIAIFAMTTGGLHEVTVPIERDDLASRIASLGSKIRGRAAISEIEAESAALHRLLIAPLQARLGGVRELVIVPDRQLYALPFSALYDSRSGRYLAEDYVIRFASSAPRSMAADGGALSPALVVADPSTPNAPRLDASREEAGNIAAIHHATLLGGDDATPQRFVETAAGSALIHYAGHADSEAGDAYGALLLAGPGGVLSSRDIARMELTRKPLVVLAACGTFRGDPVHTAGMASVARAFLIAGARAVVGTLWEIDDDAAAPLFLQFHKSLHAGALPARALHESQLAMLHAADARLRHPATWSPVELLGKD
ncbi:MAG: hypothetical protein JWO56_1159, partial [Acidobacteria bacterium]|nr:hypothetical protein [Acidobacteriota bacterium]